MISANSTTVPSLSLQLSRSSIGTASRSSYRTSLSRASYTCCVEARCAKRRRLEARPRQEEARLRQEEARLRQEEARLRQEEARLRQDVRCCIYDAVWRPGYAKTEGRGTKWMLEIAPNILALSSQSPPR